MSTSNIGIPGSLGHYCPAGASAVTPCPSGTFQTAEGQASIEACAKCGPGEEDAQDKASCSVCPAGKYNTASGGTCTLCPAGEGEGEGEGEG